MANSKPKYLVKVRYLGYLDNEQSFDREKKLEELINKKLELYDDEIFVNIIQHQRKINTTYYMITKYKNKNKKHD